MTPAPPKKRADTPAATWHKLTEFDFHRRLTGTPGIGILRLSPRSQSMGDVVLAYRECINGTIPAGDALTCVERGQPGASCDGYWLGRPGMEWSLNP